MKECTRTECHRCGYSQLEKYHASGLSKLGVSLFPTGALDVMSLSKISVVMYSERVDSNYLYHENPYFARVQIQNLRVTDSFPRLLLTLTMI